MKSMKAASIYSIPLFSPQFDILLSYTTYQEHEKRCVTLEKVLTVTKLLHFRSCM
jgi:carbohydrate-binding DOMON domain-containing protein